MIVHVYTYVPATLAVAVDVPDDASLNVLVPGPLNWVHAPVPILGVLPPKEPLVSVPHKFCVPPAVAVVGLA